MASIIIPEDVIRTHILRRLPSKSIGQFRCVSKRWLTLLTDPHFIQTHQKTLNTNRFIFVSGSLTDAHPPKTTTLCSVPYNKAEEEAVPKETIIELPFELQSLCIHGSVNGLVFASSYKTLPHKKYTYFVFNPTTKHYVELPVCTAQFFGTRGFGYDSVSGDYKVVVFSQYENYERDVYLYNIRTNTMKLVMNPSPYQDYHFTRLSGVFVNGHLHWILNNRSTQELVIVVFSLADEKFIELPPPNSREVDLSDSDTKLVSLGYDKLAIFYQVTRDIWVMNEYGVHKSWTKIIVNGFHEISLFQPVVFYDNGKVLFKTSKRLWIYHVEEGTFTKSVDITCIKKYFTCAYAESLVSPPKFSSTSE